MTNFELRLKRRRAELHREIEEHTRGRDTSAKLAAASELAKVEALIGRHDALVEDAAMVLGLEEEDPKPAVMGKALEVLLEGGAMEDPS